MENMPNKRQIVINVRVFVQNSNDKFSHYFFYFPNKMHAKALKQTKMLIKCQLRFLPTKVSGEGKFGLEEEIEIWYAAISKTKESPIKVQRQNNRNEETETMKWGTKALNEEKRRIKTSKIREKRLFSFVYDFDGSVKIVKQVIAMVNVQIKHLLGSFGLP